VSPVGTPEDQERIHERFKLGDEDEIDQQVDRISPSPKLVNEVRMAWTDPRTVTRTSGGRDR